MMRTRFLLAFMPCALLGFVVNAAQAADRYTIDPDHTSAVFEYSHWGLSRQHGRFDRSAGFIEMDDAAGSGNIYIEIDTTSLHTSNSAFTDTLRSNAYFDTAQYPKMTFKSSALTFQEGKLQAAAGDLTIKGITKPVTLEISAYNCRFMLVYGKRACGANGSAKILRSEFDLGRYAPFVSDEVTLYIAVEAIKDY